LQNRSLRAPYLPAQVNSLAALHGRLRSGVELELPQVPK
jgi:hypothetical protein